MTVPVGVELIPQTILEEAFDSDNFTVFPPQCKEKILFPYPSQSPLETIVFDVKDDGVGLTFD